MAKGADYVPAAVLSQTKNLRLREAMLYGSSLEGGWTSPFPVGDQGTSFGPYQMHEGGALTAAGLTPQQAENAVTATKAMLPAYQSAVKSISDQLWKSDPQYAAEQAAVAAERPAQPYNATDSADALNSRWQDVQDVLHGKKSTLGMPKGGGGNNSSPPQGNRLLSFLGIPTLGGLKTDMERVGLVVFGALLIIVGIIVLAIPAGKAAVQTVGAVRSGGATLTNASGKAKEADKQRRQAIADRSIELGEKKLALKQQRENRLAARG